MKFGKAAIILALVAAVRAGYDPLSITGIWLINSYKMVLSPLQGRGVCNFWPTCSQFTKEAIQLHGFLPGVVMGADRLMRCSPFAWDYLGRFYQGSENNRIRDPVANHTLYRPAFEGQHIASIAEDRQPMADSLSFTSDLFAERLFRNGAYQQAATEFLRLRFSTPSPGLRNYAGLMAAESYLKAGDFDRARYTFEEFMTPEIEEFSRYGVGRTLFAQGRYSEARPVFEGLDEGEKGRIFAAWCLFREMKFDSGAELLGGRTADTVIERLSRMDGRTISRRSRLVSSLLSLVIPGAGQLYSGRAGDGAYAFLTIAGTGLASYWFATHPERDRSRVKLVLFTSLTALFHAGNVFGASIAARDYNDYQKRRYLASADELFSRLELEPDYRPLVDTAGSGN